MVYTQLHHVGVQYSMKGLKGLLQYGVHTVTESIPVCVLEILTGRRSLCTGDANLRFPSFLVRF